jgi:hypothetical protein
MFILDWADPRATISSKPEPPPCAGALFELLIRRRHDWVLPPTGPSPSSTARRVAPASQAPFLLFLSASSPTPTPFPFCPMRQHWSRKELRHCSTQSQPQITLPPSLSLHRAIGPLHHQKLPSGTPGSTDSPQSSPTSPPSPSAAVPDEPPSLSPCQVGFPSSARARATALATSYHLSCHRARARCGDRSGARPLCQRPLELAT